MAHKRRQIYRLRNCVVCGKAFRAARYTAKTCSPACRKRLSRAGQIKPGKPVTPVTIYQLELLVQKHQESI